MLARARIALVGAAGGLLAVAVVWFAAYHVSVLQRVDQKVLRGFVDLQGHPHVRGLATRVAQICDPQPYTLIALVLVALAGLRRRAWLAVGVGILLVGAPLTTELLKPLLARPRPASQLFGNVSPIAPVSWPSGHATAAMSIALALTLVAPGRLRSWAAAGGAVFTVAVCFSFLTLEWHYPSDVLGGFLIAFIWAALVAAGVLQAERNRQRTAHSPADGPVPLADALGPPAAALLGALAIAAAVALARPHQVLHYASGHRAFVVGGTAIGALALTLATGMSLLARRSSGPPGGPPPEVRR